MIYLPQLISYITYSNIVTFKKMPADEKNPLEQLCAKCHEKSIKNNKK